MADKQSNWNPCFHPSHSQLGNKVNLDSSKENAVVGRPASCKAKQHRKRHVMPGPAGLFFQQSQTQSFSLPTDLKRIRRSGYTDGPHTDDEEDDNDNLPHSKPVSVTTTGTSFYSPAWMMMQIDLGYGTPSLPSYLSVEDKYRILRPFYPKVTHYLLPDVLHGEADWNLSPRSLLVLVQTSQALTDNLWTISLMDETCATMGAWIQPSFVKNEQQQNLSYQTTIQPGLVWLLQDVTVMLVASKDRTKQLERMLLIKQENIQRVWSPMQADDVGEAPYREWVDRRNSLTAQALKRIREMDLLEESKTPEPVLRSRPHDGTAACEETRPAAEIVPTIAEGLVVQSPKTNRNADFRGSLPGPSTTNSLILPNVLASVSETGTHERPAETNSRPLTINEGPEPVGIWKAAGSMPMDLLDESDSETEGENESRSDDNDRKDGHTPQPRPSIFQLGAIAGFSDDDSL